MEQLDADINALNGEISELGTTIEGLDAKITKATEARNAEHDAYVVKDTNVTGAISAVERAIEAMKGSKEAMQEMVGEFICFVTSEANDLCKEDPQPGKKTLHGAHITGACANLDLAELVAPIRAAALPTSRGSLPDARAKGKIAKQNSFNDLTSIEAHAMSSLAVAC